MKRVKRFEISLLLDELKEYSLSFLPIHEIYFVVSKVSKQFQQICNELLLHEYNKVRIEHFNQPPITSDLFTSSERLKFVKFSIRNHIYQYATFIVKNTNSCIKFFSRPPLSPKFLKQAKDEFDELSSIFNNFHDLPDRDNKLAESTNEILSKKFNDKYLCVIGDSKSGKHALIENLFTFTNCNQDRKRIQSRSQNKSFLNFQMSLFQYHVDYQTAKNLSFVNYFILMENPYSSNVLADFERLKMLIKENVELAELMVVTTMKDLEGSQPRFISQEEANWFAYQNFNGALHRNITHTQLEEPFIVSCYCMIMRHILSNLSFDEFRGK